MTLFSCVPRQAKWIGKMDIRDTLEAYGRLHPFLIKIQAIPRIVKHKAKTQNGTHRGGLCTKESILHTINRSKSTDSLPRNPKKRVSPRFPPRAARLRSTLLDPLDKKLKFDNIIFRAS